MYSVKVENGCISYNNKTFLPIVPRNGMPKYGRTSLVSTNGKNFCLVEDPSYLEGCTFSCITHCIRIFNLKNETGIERIISSPMPDKIENLAWDNDDWETHLKNDSIYKLSLSPFEDQKNGLFFETYVTGFRLLVKVEGPSLRKRKRCRHPFTNEALSFLDITQWIDAGAYYSYVEGLV